MDLGHVIKWADVLYVVIDSAKLDDHVRVDVAAGIDAEDDAAGRDFAVTLKKLPPPWIDHLGPRPGDDLTRRDRRSGAISSALDKPDESDALIELARIHRQAFFVLVSEPLAAGFGASTGSPSNAPAS